MSSAIEKALTTDFLAVAALDRMVWPDTPETFIPDGEHVWRVWAEHATLLVARTTGGLQLSETGDICGAVVMFPSDTGETFLHKIMVHPDSRGQGIGSALMQAALSRAESDVLLTVDPENAPAVQLYRNFGFDIRERVTGYYRPHEDRYVMVYPVRTPSDG